MINEPLGLPQGSVRALIALVIIVGLIVVVVTDNANVSIIKDLALVIIGFYFGSRPQGMSEVEKFEMLKKQEGKI